PLRSEQDRRQLRQGVAEGVIDAICSHHEPLSESAKLAPFPDTLAGISGFDTFMALAVKLVTDGVLTPLQLAERIVHAPSRIAGIEAYRHATGGWALIDPNQVWQVQADQMQSAGKNTPFYGQQLVGRLERLLVD
ncbi:MAG: hypothetical protein ACEQSD_09965, partial [Flavobacteriales bacterium]